MADRDACRRPRNSNRKRRLESNRDGDRPPTPDASSPRWLGLSNSARKRREELSREWDCWEGEPPCPDTAAVGQETTQLHEPDDPSLRKLHEHSAVLSKAISKLRKRGDALMSEEKILKGVTKCDEKLQTQLKDKARALRKQALGQYWEAYQISQEKLSIQSKLDEIYRNVDRYSKYTLDESLMRTGI